MRIISGTHKGRSFFPPSKLPVRPTTDFGKESLFNILGNRVNFEELIALDLFSGTGNISYELASRGCADIIAVDGNYNCCEFIKKTATDFGFDKIKVIKQDALAFLKAHTKQYDIIFADPPYDFDKTDLIPQLVFENKLLTEGGMLIVEHPKEKAFNHLARFLEQRNYSKVNFSIFK